MFKIIKSAAAIAALLGVAATTPAAAFVSPAPGAIIKNVIAPDASTAGSLVTTVSCGGIDCDAPSQRGYSYKGRYNSGGRQARNGNRWRDSKPRHYRSDRRWRGHSDRRWRKRHDRRKVGSAVRGLITTFIDRRW